MLGLKSNGQKEEFFSQLAIQIQLYHEMQQIKIFIFIKVSQHHFYLNKAYTMCWKSCHWDWTNTILYRGNCMLNPNSLQTFNILPCICPTWEQGKLEPNSYRHLCKPKTIPKDMPNDDQTTNQLKSVSTFFLFCSCMLQPYRYINTETLVTLMSKHAYWWSSINPRV